jgi:hypothetical protein
VPLGARRLAENLLRYNGRVGSLGEAAPGGLWMGAAAPPGTRTASASMPRAAQLYRPVDVRLRYLIAAAELDFGRVARFDSNIF